MTQYRLAGLPVGEALPSYRGVDRPPPPPVPDIGGAGVSFSWYAKEVDQSGGIRDVARATELIDAYGNLNPPIQLQLLEVTAPGEAHSDGQMLGYDLVAGSYSLLSWGLDLGREPKSPLSAADLYHPLRPLLKAAGQHYKGLLNSAILFSDDHVASECLGALMAAQSIRPGLWGHASDEFEVLRVVALANPDL